MVTATAGLVAATMYTKSNELSLAHRAVLYSLKCQTTWQTASICTSALYAELLCLRRACI